jgi:hypothetical protein
MPLLSLSVCFMRHWNAAVAGGLSQMRGGDDAISHAPGRGGGDSDEGRFFGDDMQLLPEQDRAGCEDV